MKVRIFQENTGDMEGAIQALLDTERPSWCQVSLSADNREGELVAMVLYDHAPVLSMKATFKNESGGENGPPCERCGALMVKRFRKADSKPFWGCSTFPKCRSIQEYSVEGEQPEQPEQAPPVSGSGWSDDGDDIPF